VNARLSALALAIGSLWLAPVARAQDSAPIDDAAAAFARGGEAFTAQRYDEALTAFRRAYELAPHDRVRFNMAVCLEELGRFREAAVEFEAAAASHQLDGPTRERARAAAEAARARLATLAFRSTGASVHVEVDGEVACATPCEATVDPGEHRVTYRDPRGEHEDLVRVEAGGRVDRVLEVAPEPIAPIERDETREPDTDDASIDLGPLGLAGIGVATLGTGGIIGFGVRFLDVKAQYERDGCAVAPCDDGELARDLTNVSIGVAAVGAVLVLIDLLFIDD
jgi:hypothetical protein